MINDINIPNLDYFEDRSIDIDGDYLIVAPIFGKSGSYQMYTERECLSDNILTFLNRHPGINSEIVSVFELRKIDMHIGME